MQKVFFKTFGCRTNIYDTELLKSYIKDYEITNDESKADIIIINSCTVTNSADYQTRSYINTMQKNGAKIVLAGCGAVSKGLELYKQNGVFGVLGGENKQKLNELLKAEKRFFALGDLNFIDKNIVKRYENHTKAFIKIQEGCDFACSYCIIPSVRGKSRSIDPEVLLNQAKTLAQNGFTELVLTGTNIGSYGLKSEFSLGRLLQKMGQIKGIKRIRLGSLEPVQLDESFFEITNEPWLEKHLHIALQHTSEKMLRLMRRRSHTKNDLTLFEFLQSKGFALGTDFIVGHPGETPEIWDEALNNFKKFKLTHLHAFVFSPRSNTYSATLKSNVKGDVAKTRLNLLKQIVAQNNLNFRLNLSEKNHKLSVLIEQKKDDNYIGYDEFFNKIIIKSKFELSKKWLEIAEFKATKEGNFADFSGANLSLNLQNLEENYEK